MQRMGQVSGLVPPRVAIVGFGYVGSCLAATLAERGFAIIGIDSDPDLLSSLVDGRYPASEPSLTSALERATASNRLTFTSDYRLVTTADVVMLTVGTPVDSRGRFESAQIEQACRQLSPHLQPGQLVIAKSTVPPGTTENLIRPLLQSSGLVEGADFSLAYCPERLSEGSAMSELATTPMIVSGCSPLAHSAATQFWESALGVPVISVPTPREAEIAKLASNWWIDAGVALANELSKLCQVYETDVLEVIAAANTLPKGDSRVNILLPSIGVGGACLTKDPWMAWHAAATHGIPLQTVETSRDVNTAMPAHTVSLIVQQLAELGKRPEDCTIAILGVAFKSNTADLRSTPVRDVVAGLRAVGVDVRLHDALADPTAVEAMFGLTPEPDVESAIAAVDCVAVLAGHAEYTELSAQDLARRVADHCLVFDGRRYWSREEIADLRARGLRYCGVGRL